MQQQCITKVPYVNIAGQHVAIKDELLEAVGRVIDSGNFVMGKEVEEFEQRFAELCGVKYAVGVNSGTDALILALRVLGVGSGDEVITVANSFVTSTSCIVCVGAKPVFVDVGEDYNINPSLIEKAITPKTKAIIPVHWSGRPCKMDDILKIAQENGLTVIEDCAQAVSAEFNGQKVGSFAEMGCFSLHPLKTLNACGDGGVITTNDTKFYSQLMVLRNNGFLNRNRCVAWSSNSRLDTIQAAMLLVKLNYLGQWTAKRTNNARYYQKYLSGIAQIQIPIDQIYEKSVYHTFIIQAQERDALKIFLEDQGIETKIHYPIPIHLQDVAKELGNHVLPVTEQQSKKILTLPIHPELTEENLQYIVTNIRDFYKNRKGE